jgi:hypothetical protein
MSQSDYIKLLKSATELKTQTDYPTVLSSDEYISFKDYGISTTVIDTSKLYGTLRVNGIQSVFQMSVPNVSNCPTFVLCKNTNTRPNRVWQKTGRTMLFYCSK